MKTAQLLDVYGNPVRKSDLRAEVARATIGGVRSPIDEVERPAPTASMC